MRRVHRKNWYRKRSRDSYKAVCGRLVRATFPKDHHQVILRNLLRDVNAFGRTGFYRKLIFTVKTHKPQGKVVSRNVHASANNPFRPLMRLVVKLIKQKTKQLSHLVRDSTHLCTLLDQHVFRDGENFRLVKADIKDFS